MKYRVKEAVLKGERKRLKPRQNGVFSQKIRGTQEIKDPKGGKREGIRRIKQKVKENSQRKKKTSKEKIDSSMLSEIKMRNFGTDRDLKGDKKDG